MRRLLALAALVAAAGCSAPERGTVVAKDYDPPYTWFTQSCSAWRTSYSTYGSGRNRRTTSSRTCIAYIPVRHYHLPEWSLTLRDGDSEGSRSVYRVAWERCPVGSRYPACAETVPQGDFAGGG